MDHPHFLFSTSVVIWTTYLVVDLGDAGIVLQAGVGVHALLVHVAVSVVRGHNSSKLTIAFKIIMLFNSASL